MALTNEIAVPYLTGINQIVSDVCAIPNRGQKDLANWVCFIHVYSNIIYQHGGCKGVCVQMRRDGMRE